MPYGFRCEVKQCKRKCQWQSVPLVWTKKHCICWICRMNCFLSSGLGWASAIVFGNSVWKPHWCLYSPTELWICCQCSPFCCRKLRGELVLQSRYVSTLCRLHWRKVLVVNCSRPDLWGSHLGHLSLPLSFTHQLILFQESMSCLPMGSGGIRLCLFFLLDRCRWNLRHGI